MSISPRRGLRKCRQRPSTSIQPRAGIFRDSTGTTSSDSFWNSDENRLNASKEMDLAVRADSALSGFPDSWGDLRSHVMTLRSQLAGEIRAVQVLISAAKHGTALPVSTEEKSKLESAYKRLAEFKKSGEAWQDIHGADSDLLSTARDLLDSL